MFGAGDGHDTFLGFSSSKLQTDYGVPKEISELSRFDFNHIDFVAEQFLIT